jgi:hypothetical protein
MPFGFLAGLTFSPKVVPSLMVENPKQQDTKSGKGCPDNELWSN